MRRPAVLPLAPILMAVGLVVGAAAGATTLDLIPVGSPLEDEVRVLEVLGAPLRLPRLGMRPLQVEDLAGLERPLPGAAGIARARLLRALARDLGGADSVTGAVPRLLQLEYPDEQRFEISAGLEGAGIAERDKNSELESGSGLHVRFAARTGRWLAYSHILAGYVLGGTRFAERILPRTDAVLHSEETYLAYTATRGVWGVVFGQGRWHWGPGQEASLLLSKTSPPLTGLAFRGRIEPLRADGMVFNAVLEQAAGEQLAAHRLEWQPFDNLRLGLGEAARYKSTSWHPLYLIGTLPYAMVQSLMARNEPDSVRALRNNVAAALDVAWRAAPGTRLYGELLLDDIKTDRSPIVSKVAYQLGWEGVGTVRGQRVTWNTEFTRLTRFVYTSHFGRSFALQGVPIGFPTGPDSRRVRVRGAWDPSVAWQVFASASRTDRGESGLDVPFVPGSPVVDPGSFDGVVETTRDFDVGVRFWPTSGLDLSATAGVVWVDDEDHVPGHTRRAPRASLSLRWVR